MESTLARSVVFFTALVLTVATCARARDGAFSVYVPTSDGTRLAVDVHLPDRTGDEKVPALLQLTRYWRSAETPDGTPRYGTGALERFFLDHGYAIVLVDVRGSGASFGTRPVEYGPQEVRDGFDIVDWVVRQPWSSGKVGAYGTSYTGTTAELVAATGHPAIKAVIPGWSDFDVYRSPVRPYGLIASGFLRVWSDHVGRLDANDVQRLGASVRRVDADRDGSLLAAAVAEHRRNPVVFELAREAEFRDQRIRGAASWLEVSPVHWRSRLEASGVPMLVLTSWLDAGSADGALQRFRHFSNPQKLVILASSHGGGSHASPFQVSGSPLPPRPPVSEQFEMRLDFFDHHLKGAENGVAAWPAIRYYNLGEEAFRDSAVWPPAGTRRELWYLGAERSLSRRAPRDTRQDVYAVDPAVSTGPSNRWQTQMGQPVLNLDDRAAMDRRMLTYTSAPLEADLQISGTAAVTLHLSSDHSDGAVLAYLEVVGKDGRSRYLTEGGLRLIHHRPAADPLGDDGLPYHSFAAADAAGLEPRRSTVVAFRMWPISALVRKGDRLRLAFAGADEGTFDRLPAAGVPELTLHHGGERASLLDLPVVGGPPAPPASD